MTTYTEEEIITKMSAACDLREASEAGIVQADTDEAAIDAVKRNAAMTQKSWRVKPTL